MILDSIDMPPRSIRILTQDYRGGIDVSDILIRAHIKLVSTLIANAVKYHPQKEDDIEGVALLSLCQTVKKAQTHLYDDNITNYIAYHVKKAICSFLQKDHLIRMPVNQYRRLDWAMRINYLEVMKTLETGDPVARDYPMETVTAPDDQILCEDLIECMHLNPKESRVLDMLLEEYSMSEIGRELQFSRQHIEQIKWTIRGKMEIVYKENLWSI